jgi:hypothetical protein
VTFIKRLSTHSPVRARLGGMKPKQWTYWTVLALIAAFGFAACGSHQEPIRIYVTPTPQAVADSHPVEAGVQEQQNYAAPAGVSAAQAQAPAQPPTPTPTVPPGVIFGPIVGPGYTLEPTETRLPPTEIPTVIPTAGPSPTPAPSLRRALMGIQIHPNIDKTDFAQVLYYVRDLNLGWIKFQFNWSLLESAPGQYTDLFNILRLYVQEAHNNNLNVLVSVAKAPGWSRTPDTDGVMRENGPPDDPQVLANFLSGMLSQIGLDANGAPYVSAVEIWNEPNLQREWYGHPMTGDEYMRYFRPAYDAVRAFSPAITIISGAPAPTGDSDGSTDDRIWMQQLYNAGLAQYGQGIAVGVHPYGWANPPDARCCANPSHGWDDKPQFFFLDTIEDYRNIMVANGHSAAQLWATEFGWATFDGLRTRNGQGPQPSDPPEQPFFSFINQQQQAEYTVRAFYLAQARDYMGPMILWNLNFATLSGAVDRSDPQTGYGVLDSTWQPRPVYYALRQIPKN